MFLRFGIKPTSASFLSSSVLSFTLGAILPSSLPGQLGLASLSGVPTCFPKILPPTVSCKPPEGQGISGGLPEGGAPGQ